MEVGTLWDMDAILGFGFPTKEEWYPTNPIPSAPSQCGITLFRLGHAFY